MSSTAAHSAPPVPSDSPPLLPTDTTTTTTKTETDEEPTENSSTTTTNDKKKKKNEDKDEEEEEKELEMADIRAAVDELDENLDEAFGNAAKSIWDLATSVTGSVQSAVATNVPLEQISHSLSTINANAKQGVSGVATSVKSVAASVQRNAQQMEQAILSKANDTTSSSTTSTSTRSTNGVQRPAELQKVGETLSNTVGGLWSGFMNVTSNLLTTEGDEGGVEGWERADGGNGNGRGGVIDGNKVGVTRVEKKIVQLQADPNVYCEPASDLQRFEEWGKGFNLDDEQVTTECLGILGRHETIADLYERVVPGIVEEEMFWMRYFFAKHVVEQEEKRRKMLLERAEMGAQNEDGWGDEEDDWNDGEGEEEEVKKEEEEDSKEENKSQQTCKGSNVEKVERMAGGEEEEWEDDWE